MKKVMNKLMLSCKKATELIEKKRIAGLSFVERLQLNFHKRACKACAAYEKQSDLIEKALEKQQDQEKSIFQDKLSEEAKMNIIERLAKGN